MNTIFVFNESSGNMTTKQLNNNAVDMIKLPIEMKSTNVFLVFYFLLF